MVSDIHVAYLSNLLMLEASLLSLHVSVSLSSSSFCSFEPPSQGSSVTWASQYHLCSRRTDSTEKSTIQIQRKYSTKSPLSRAFSSSLIPDTYPASHSLCQVRNCQRDKPSQLLHMSRTDDRRRCITLCSLCPALGSLIKPYYRLQAVVGFGNGVLLCSP